jgi:hypothetical protein
LSGTSLGDPLDYEYAHADRRGDQPEPDHHNDDNDEPDRVVSSALMIGNTIGIFSRIIANE